MSKEKQGDLIEGQDVIIQEVEPEIIVDPPADTKEVLVHVSDEPKELAVQSEIGNLLQLAITNKSDMDTLERLITMKNAEEDRNCKKEFDFHFSEMQKDYIPATKGSDVYNKAGTAILYKFCNLESILKVYSPIIAEHGFSFKWKEEMKTETVKVISCILSGYGHEEISAVEIPINEATTFTNSIQQRGVSTSYGKRYSFINLLGVIIADEDDDAASLNFEDGVQYAREIEWIRTCKTKEDLIKTWKEVWTELENDKIGRDVMKIIYNKKKEEFIK